MLIQLKKGRDGPSTLACVRDDGTRTWGKVHPFFPLHDLTHCAVESVLEFHHAFFGLIESGRDIDDFSRPGASAWLPSEAMLAECIVGILDRERANGEALATDEFNETLGESLRGQGVAPFGRIGPAELTAIRQLRDALQARWYRASSGETVSVRFPASLTSPGAPRS
jgi:hypothetical protein